MEDILDLETYPLNDIESPDGVALVDRCKADLAMTGLFNLPGLVRAGALARCLDEVEQVLAANAYEHRQWHNIYFRAKVDGLAADHPALKESLTSNRKICADQIPDSILAKIYNWPAFAAFLAAVMEKPALHPMDDPLACMNVMAYRDGEALNWHFDRSEFTTTLLLQAPDEGGEFQYRTGLRTSGNANYDAVGRFLEDENRTCELVELKPGTLNVFRGQNTAHCVSPVVGERQRIIAVFCYYEKPGVKFSDEDRVRFYGRAA